ncbi:MAG: LysR family transcriptional regulator [Asticcacaulis sp.]|nr:LysR family transcriptional regulator [Asticcacaulis sp.]
MDRNLLPHLPVVAAVARHSSFARAAAELQMSPSSVSHAVRMVETHLGQPVFVRTTRSVRLTDAGQALLDAVEPGLAYLSEVSERLRADRGQVSGTLRLNVPRVSLPHLTPLLLRMAEMHPGLTVEVVADEALTDIVGQGFDAGVRLGNMIAQDMIAVRLTPPFSAIMVASPAYIARKGAPQSIAELQTQACIGYRLLASGGIYDWDLSDNGHDVTVRVSGPVRVTDGLYARELGLAGLGIAYVFEPHVRDDLACGRLVHVLPETAIEEPGFFLYFPERQRHAPKLRALLDLIHA